MKKIFVFIICLGLVFFTAGCGGKTVKTDSGSVNVKKGNIVVKSNDGSTTTIATDQSSKLSLPDGYPKDILPVIDDAKVQSSQNLEKDGKKAFMVNLEVNKSSEDVIKYYKDKLSDVTDMYEGTTGEQYLLTGKRNGYTIAVYITPQNDNGAKTSIILSLEPVTE